MGAALQKETILIREDFINHEAAIGLGARLGKGLVRKAMVREGKDTRLGQIQRGVVLDFDAGADGGRLFRYDFKIL